MEHTVSTSKPALLTPPLPTERRDPGMILTSALELSVRRFQFFVLPEDLLFAIVNTCQGSALYGSKLETWIVSNYLDSGSVSLSFPQTRCGSYKALSVTLFFDGCHHQFLLFPRFFSYHSSRLTIYTHTQNTVYRDLSALNLFPRFFTAPGVFVTFPSFPALSSVQYQTNQYATTRPLPTATFMTIEKNAAEPQPT